MRSLLAKITIQDVQIMMTLISRITGEQLQTIKTLIHRYIARLAGVTSTRCPDVIFPPELRQILMILICHGTPQEIQAIMTLISKIYPEEAQAIKNFLYKITPGEAQTMMTLISSITLKEIQTIKTIISRITQEQVKTIKTLMSKITSEEVETIITLMKSITPTEIKTLNYLLHLLTKEELETIARNYNSKITPEQTRTLINLMKSIIIPEEEHSTVNTDASESEDQGGNDTEENMMNQPRSRRVQPENPSNEEQEPQFVADAIDGGFHTPFEKDSAVIQEAPGTDAEETLMNLTSDNRPRVHPESSSNEAPGPQFVADAIGNIFLADSAVIQEPGTDAEETVMNPTSENRLSVHPESSSNEAPTPQFVADAVGNIFLADSSASREQPRKDEEESVMNPTSENRPSVHPACPNNAFGPQFVANAVGNVVHNFLNAANSRDGFGTPGLRAHPLRMKYMYVEMGEIDLTK